MTDSLQLGGVKNVTSGDLYWQATKDVPDAIVDFGKDAWAHKKETALHVLKEGAESLAFGAAIGYVVPAKGPAAMIVAAGFTIPMAISAYDRLSQANKDLHKVGANPDAIAQGLAKDAVSSGVDLGINFAGGYAGTEVGMALAKRPVIGAPAQFIQKTAVKWENEGILLAKAGLDGLRSTFGSRMTMLGEDTAGAGIAGKSTALDSTAGGPKLADTSLDQKLGTDAAAAQSPSFPFLQQRFAGLGQRVSQYSLATRDVSALANVEPQPLQMVFGSTHGHSRYSDGMGLPIDLYNKAIQEGQQVTAITDHDHAAARGGVKPDDPRAKDEAGTPLVADDPAEYVQTQKDAAATTIPGKHVSLFGVEVGTIGSEPHGHGGEGDTGGGQSGGGGHGPGRGSGRPHGGDAGGAEAEGIVASAAPGSSGKLIGPEPPDSMFTATTADGDAFDPKSLRYQDWKAAQVDSLSAEHLGGPTGVNHINILELPTFVGTVKQPKTGLSALFARLTGGDMTVDVQANPITVPDGDYKTMSARLSLQKDSTGNTPIVTLNHPRFLADRSPSLPDALRNRDYGRKSFANDDEWRQDFVKKFVRGIELIKGGALTPHPVDTVPVGNIDLRSYTGYLGLGVEAAPLFGRDFHFGDPVGNPGSTGFLVDKLDKPSVLNALRERRTIATTNGNVLNGYLMANDKFYMGSILDQSAVPDLSLKMKVGGQIDPNAQYTLKVYGDDQVLDGNDASVIQTKQVTGQQLLDANGEVNFDPITHTQGNNSLYFVEVTREMPGATANATAEANAMAEPNATADGAKANSIQMWTAPIWVKPLAGDSHGMLTRFAAGNAAQWPILHNFMPFPTAAR